jgi:hypothetical protein
MKIYYCFDQLILCGGVLVPFEHCQGLVKLGCDARIISKGFNYELQKYYPTVKVCGFEELNNLEENDVLINCWWPQCEELEKYKGRKIQFIQGNDLKSYTGQDWKDRCLATRRKENWELMAVSQYAGEWTGREFAIIPNGINDRFFIKHNLERDIDALIEGNDEPNKNIMFSINEAKKDGHKKIVWMGRETHPIEGVESITNPPQEEIPKIYQRAKHFYKHSLSEGFCLPLAEAIVSGCVIHAGEMGNKFEPNQDFHWESQIQKLCKYLSLN